MSAIGLVQAREKMRGAGVAPAAVETFTRFYRLLESGVSGLIREEDVEPLPQLARADELEPSDGEAAALDRTAIIKLNGGLGTSMGMDKAKSLLPVRRTAEGEDLTFLDIIVGQVRAARAATGARLPLVFMNSFRTQADTLALLGRYDDVAMDGLPLDFLQNREPKLRADDLTPVEWPSDPDLEWCPPGHGDLYPALHAAGVVRALLDAGFRYASVSNSDNLGAAPEARIAGWFAASGAPYAAEMCLKTPADVKGGQLVVRKADGRIVQRETAQTHPDDLTVGLDPTRHRYFHTNNLWFDLEVLAAELDRTGGVLELPLIRNDKTVDPADPASTKVVQIESAMGAAVAVFEGATAIEVGRDRFLPVKTTNDLLVLRSDVYELTDDYRVVAQVPAPLVSLSAPYKTISGFDSRFPAEPPSLRGATSLTVQGDWNFGARVRVLGDARLPDPDEALVSLDIAPTDATGAVPDHSTIDASGIRS
ncbi:UTP--glucose-1-phosphate uridylyltransferase [Xylanimonas allomyrinae]|uniref:UTP--glucose-1-phosphate uridylyltransferase n=1 Tax=Xylanimonas allomyrinae TaxID=2509459 RepID=A0A4P6EP88_9MICO|nr:UTP--glucose-1-phosphate uridylyltransferase [Xylanimonas allomyrinae]QAY64562.1 UTP--glucose-1-phosphate uridylyltransferase [Xylanimonas allomyrinae]